MLADVLMPSRAIAPAGWRDPRPVVIGMTVTSFGEFGITPNEPGFVAVPSPTPCPVCARKPVLGAWLAAAGAGASVVAVAGLPSVLCLNPIPLLVVDQGVEHG